MAAGGIALTRSRCGLMHLFPYLVLPQGAPKGARLTAWCLHRVLSKNARKSSRELVRERFMSSNLMTVKCGVPSLPFHSTTCKSNVISCAEITKMSRYFDSVGLVLFCYLSL